MCAKQSDRDKALGRRPANSAPALRESEERYRSLMESAPDAILVHRDGRVLYANPAAISLYGAKDFEELAAHNILDLVPPSEAQLAVERTNKVQSGRKLPIREGKILRLDGREVPIEVVSSPVEYRGGTAAQAVIRDITDRKRAQAEIESLAKFPAENPNPVLRVSRYGVLMYANQASNVWLEDWGCAVGEMAPDSLRALVAEVLGRRKPKQTIVDMEMNGRIWSLNVIPIASAGYANVYGRDITSRRRAEDALREGEARFSALYSSMVEGVAIHEVVYNDSGQPIDYIISDVNPSYELITGLSRAESVGKRASQLYGTREAPYLDIYARVASSGKPHSFETYFPPMQKHFSITVFSPARGTFATAFQDISERKQAEEALRDSESNYRRIVETAQEGIMTADTEGVITFANAKMAEMLGYSVQELIGKPGASLVDPSDTAAVAALAARSERGKSGESERYEARWLRKDGSELWVYASGTPIYDFTGKHVGNLAMCADITERKRAEEALREREADLARAQAVGHIGSWRLDVRRNILNWSAEAYRMFGIPLGTPLTYEAFLDCVLPEDREAVDQAWQAGLRGERYSIDHRTIVGGDLRWIHEQAELEFDESGALLGGFGTCQDVTARKQAEEALRLQSNALQAAANGIVITDPHGAIQWVNGAFTRLTGYSAEEAMGRNPRVLKSGRHDHAFYDDLWSTILAGRVWQGEIVNKRRDGTFYTEEMTITPVLDDNHVISRFIAIKQDISARKRLEAELEKTRSEFLGEVSHELKTPLTAIKGCASMALSSPIPPDAAETRELFDIIDTQANRLTDLVANLLDVTRIEAGRLSMEPGPAVLADIVEEARVIFEHSQYPHPLEVMLPSRLPALRADGRRIVQVLSNLFTNAAKYSSPTAPIILTAESAKGEVTVHVRDAGVGIPADKMPLLFQKFVRVQERGVKGTGLGLFICKGIVEAHGGRIWAESPGKGKGTVFSFTLPAIAGRPKTARDERTAGRQRAAGGAGAKPARVVAVDDEPDILHYIEHCLRSAGCEVVSTTDPLAAAELVRFHTPDIVLLDMRMPGMSGLDVLEEIRKFSQTPVTFITATQNREDVVRGREFGGTTWLEKPFSPQQLLDHVGLVLARRQRR